MFSTKPEVYPKVSGNQVRQSASAITQAMAGRLFVTLLLAALVFSTIQPLYAYTYPVEYRQLAWFYKPSSDTTTDTLVKYFDNYILTRGDESYRDTLKSKGIDSPMLQYLRFDAIQNPGSCTKQPDRNQVANRIGDYCDISTNHPGWFLLDTYGKRMVNDDFVMMDPGNSEWRAFFLTRAKEGQTTYGWNGLLLDNVEGSLVKRSQYNQMPAKYTTDSSYQYAIKGMLGYLYNNYFASAGHPLFANIVSAKDSTVWFSYLNYLDGGMCEAWGTGWGNTGWRTTTDWLDHMYRAERTQSLGKRALLVAQGDKTNYSRQQFAYASYLLIDNGRAFFRYANPTYYKSGWTYSNYLYNLGTPLGSKYLSGSKYCRDYSLGKVCVDPSAHTSSITLF